MFPALSAFCKKFVDTWRYLRAMEDYQNRHARHQLCPTFVGRFIESLVSIFSGTKGSEISFLEIMPTFMPILPIVYFGSGFLIVTIPSLCATPVLLYKCTEKLQWQRLCQCTRLIVYEAEQLELYRRWHEVYTCCGQGWSPEKTRTIEAIRNLCKKLRQWIIDTITHQSGDSHEVLNTALGDLSRIQGYIRELFWRTTALPNSQEISELTKKIKQYSKLDGIELKVLPEINIAGAVDRRQADLSSHIREIEKRSQASGTTYHNRTLRVQKALSQSPSAAIEHKA